MRIKVLTQHGSEELEVGNINTTDREETLYATNLESGLITHFWNSAYWKSVEVLER